MWDQEVFLKALHFAAEAHKEQRFPGKEYSYLVHLTSVCMEMLAALPHSPGLDGDLAVQCALLHDTIEDTEVSYEDVKKEFGKAVAVGVLALSKDKALVKPAQLKDSLERIQKQPVEVGCVKLADRISNLRVPPHYWKKDKIRSYREEAELILEMLGNCNSFLTERLKKKIVNYEW